MCIYVGATVKTSTGRIGTVAEVSKDGYAAVKHDCGWWAGPTKDLTIFSCNQKEEN